MAEAYKGLTIRIGADTTDFSRKLGSLNSAISATQAGLKQMTAALRNNPQSIDAMNQKFSLMQQQTQNLNTKLQLVNTMLRQMDDAGMGQLAAQTSNSALEARKLTDRLNQVNADLEHEHIELEKIGKTLGIAYDKTQPEAFQQAVRNGLKLTDEESRKTVSTVDMLVASVRRLALEHHEVESQLKLIQQVDTYKSLQRDSIALEAELKKLYQDMSAFRMAMPSMAEAERINRLEAEFSELENDLKLTDERARVLKESLRLDHKNIDTLNKAVETTAHQINLTAEQADNLRKRIAAIKDANHLDSIKGSMSSIQAEARTSAERFDRINAELAETKARITTAREEYKSFTNTTAESAQRFKENKERARELAQEIQILKDREKQLAQEAKEAGNAARMAEAKAGVRELEAQLEKTEAELDKFRAAGQKSSYGMYNSMRDMATSLGATVSPAVMMVATKVTSAADTVDGAFRDMKKTVDGTAEDFAKLRQAAIEFSRTHPVSADTILEIESLGGQLGIAVENLEGFANVVSNLDIATNLSAETAATQLGQLANILHWDLNPSLEDGRTDFDRYGDALVRLGNNMPTQEDRISSITMAIASTGQVMGFTTPQILGWATAIAATGQGAESSGTAISNTMIDIEAAVGEGGDALEAFAEVAGMSANDFAEEWKSKPSDALQHFVSGLKNLSDNGESATRKLDELEIRGVRQVRALLSLGETIDIVNEAQTMANDAWREGGDAAKEASQKAEGFSGKLQILKNIAQTMGASFGDKLVPVLDALISVLQTTAKVLDAMPQPVAILIAALAALAVAIPPVMRNFAQYKLTMEMFAKAQAEAAIATKSLTSSVLAQSVSNSSVGKSLTSLTDKIKKTTVAQKAMTAAGSLGTAGVLALAAAAAVAVAAIAKYIQKQNEFKNATVGLKDAFTITSGAANGLGGALSSAYSTVSKDVDDLIKKTAEFRQELVDMNQSALDNGAVLQRWADIARESNDAQIYDTTNVNKLKMAVEELNQQLGTNYEVMEEGATAYIVDADGARVDIDAIDDLVDAKKRQLEVEALLASQQRIIEERVEAEKTLAEAVSAAKVAQDEYLANIGTDQELQYAQALNDRNAEVERAQRVVDSLSESEKVAEASTYRAEHATDDFGKSVQEAAKQMPWLSNALDEISDHAFTDFMEAATNAGYTTEDLSKLTTEQVQQITDSWSNGTGEWKSVIEDATRKIDTDMSSMSESVVGSTESMSDKTASAANKMVDDVDGSFSAMRSNTIQQVSEMTGISVEELEKLAEGADLTSEEAVTQWAENIIAGKESSRKSAEAVKNAAVEALAKAQSSAETAGYNTGYGFIKKLKSWLSDASSVGYQIGANAVAGLNRGAGNASPSKFTRQSGIWFAQGFEIGMEKEEDAIEKQASLLGSLAVGALSASSSASAGYLSGIAASNLGIRGSTTNNNDNSTENVYITLNVEANDLRDMQTIDDFVAMAKRAKAQYAAS